MSVNFTAPNCVSTDTMAVVAVCAPTLLLTRVGVLVVRFGDALPFSVDLQEKKDVREVDLATPALFEDAHDGERLRSKRAIFSAGPKGERGTTA